MFQILSTSNIVDKNIVDKNWRGMKILSIYPNVGHSKSGRKLSPRVDKIYKYRSVKHICHLIPLTVIPPKERAVRSQLRPPWILSV